MKAALGSIDCLTWGSGGGGMNRSRQLAVWYLPHVLLWKTSDTRVVCLVVPRGWAIEHRLQC